MGHAHTASELQITGGIKPSQRSQCSTLPPKDTGEPGREELSVRTTVPLQSSTGVV